MSTTLTANFTALLNVPKLTVDGSNWLIFHYCFEIGVESKGAWGHFDGSSPSPANPPPTGDAAALTVLNKWKKWEREACHYLAQKLKDSTLTELLRLATVSQMWAPLSSKYTALSSHIIADMQRQFDSLKCADNGNIHTHLNALRLKYEELIGVGIVLTPDQYATRIIGSLPPYYQRYLSTISNSANAAVAAMKAAATAAATVSSISAGPGSSLSAVITVTLSSAAASAMTLDPSYIMQLMETEYD